MNIFFLDKSPKIAAQMMCNKHVVKMIVESAQMLSTAHRLRIALYKPPTNIVHGVPVTDPPQCMPEECKQDDTVSAYQTYYIVEKSRFAKWIKREIPKWFIGGSDGKRESVKLGA